MGEVKKHSNQQVVASSSNSVCASEVLILSKPGRFEQSENTSFRPSRLSNGCANAFRGSHCEWQSPQYRSVHFFAKKKAVVRNNSRPSNRHAPQIRSAGSARCVQRFDDSLLQFTLLIAIRCVLHRWENQEIRCQKLFLRFLDDRITSRKNNKFFLNPRSSKVFL